MEDKKPIISSATGYLGRKINAVTTGKDNFGVEDFNNLRDEIWREAGQSLLMPTSNFEDGSQMYKEIKDGHYLDMAGIGEMYVAGLCDIWTEAVQRAKEEDRYFCREREYIKEKYGENTDLALSDMNRFLGENGYHLKDETNAREAIYFMDLGKIYQHESEIREDSIPRV